MWMLAPRKSVVTPWLTPAYFYALSNASSMALLVGRVVITIS